MEEEEFLQYPEGSASLGVWIIESRTVS